MWTRVVTAEGGNKIKFDETAAIFCFLCITGADSIDFATLTKYLPDYPTSVLRILSEWYQNVIRKHTLI